MTLPTPIDWHTFGGARDAHEAWHETLHAGSNGTLAQAGAVMVGAATPEASITAPIGTLFVDTTGGASTTLWIKESGAGNTGWKTVDVAV